MASTNHRGTTFRLSDRLRYRFDSLLSRGAIAVIGWVGIVMGIVVVLAGVVLTLLDIHVTQDSRGVGEAVWQSFLRVMDTGTMAGDSGAVLRIVSLLVTLSGIFLASILIGLITNGISERIDALRKGRSLVVESDHTVILGWSPKVFAVVEELCLANESRKGGTGACIVILAPVEKVKMEDALRMRVGQRHGTRIVCRNGRTSDPADLALTNVAGARSVLVLTSGDSAGDAEAVTTVLALRTLLPDLHSRSIVADLSEPVIAAELASATGGDVLTVVGAEWVARIAAQASRQAGLSLVYEELSQFAGSEMYFHEEPALVGASFGDAVLAFDTSAVLGLRRTDHRIELLPSPDRKIEKGELLIVIAEDDSLIRLDGTPVGSNAPITVVPARMEAPSRQRFVIIGWNELGPSMLAELDAFLAPGSPVDILTDPEHVDPASVDPGPLLNLSVEVHRSDGIDAELLHARCADIPVDHIVVLGYRDTLTPEQADARTMLTLLHLHRMLPTSESGERASVVAELLEVRNVPLARQTATDDFVVGDGLASLVLAQLTEQRDLHGVFAELLGAGGTEISLRPATDYVDATGAATTFRDVVRTSIGRGEIAFGIRSAGGILLSPRKSTPLTVGPDTSVIVLVPERGSTRPT